MATLGVTAQGSTPLSNLYLVKSKLFVHANMAIYRHQELCNHWKSQLKSYPSSVVELFQRKEAEGNVRAAWRRTGGARRVSYSAGANENGLVLFSSNSASRANKNMKAA
jgi:hypothetical protein